jgi:hypothetical protein
VDSRRINENDLPFRPRDYALNAIAGRLRLGRDDSDFLPDKFVEQRGFSGVRPANDSDEAGAVIGLRFCS